MASQRTKPEPKGEKVGAEEMFPGRETLDKFRKTCQEGGQSKRVEQGQ